MKKKYLIIILIILVIILIGICTIKFDSNKEDENSNSNNTSITQVNTHGENSGIFVGVDENDNENYLFISIKIDKKSSKEEQVKSLISSIADSIGYNIDINSVEISENNIKIDFAKTAAPFDVINSYIPDSSPKYFIINDNVIPKTIFDSINKTLKSYFGSQTKVYFSTESENINIENEITTINIDSTKSYDENEN